MIAIVMVALGLYLLISAAVVVWVIRRARRAGRSAIRWGLSAALILYLIPFWDWIPTVATHQYYCARESGFWVYKTVDQWKKENPGVMETLVSTKNEPFSHETFDNGRGKADTYYVNDRFQWVVTQQDVSGLLPIIRTERLIKDSETNDVLARYVDFGAGNTVKNTIGPPGPWKFWLSNRYCWNGEDRATRSALFFRQFRGGEE